MGQNQYVGRAGQLAVMGELSWRGYNIAIPEIDIGDDIFAVNDRTGHLWRLQVKTASEKRQKKSSCYSFSIRNTAISMRQIPDLHFAFAMRTEDSWKFLIMDRVLLKNFIDTNNVGTPADQNTRRRFDIIIHKTGIVKCSGLDWTQFQGNWDSWPFLR